MLQLNHRHNHPSPKQTMEDTEVTITIITIVTRIRRAERNSVSRFEDVETRKYRFLCLLSGNNANYLHPATRRAIQLRDSRRG